ncbi:MAG: hypothetical protein Q9200_003596 [Gallowayella weberi]
MQIQFRGSSGAAELHAMSSTDLLERSDYEPTSKADYRCRLAALPYGDATNRNQLLAVGQSQHPPMDHLPIKSLEVDLGYVDGDLVNIGELLLPPVRSITEQSLAPSRNHESSTNLSDFPDGSTSALDPPSKTRSFYSFGNNGTLAWATPAGELLQVANCIDNRLLSADYKRSIERGRYYDDRGKVLEKALDSPQGSGYGIGISLDLNLEPLERHWVYNRWPQFTFSHNGLKIELRYCIISQSVIQEYHIRNTGQEEIPLPYIISSDICFREHRGQLSTIHSVEARKSSERSLLFQNTEVLIRNDVERCQLKMALFLNRKKQSLWAETESNEDFKEKPPRKSSVYSSAELDEADESLRTRILAGQFVDEDADSDLRRLYRRFDRGHEGLRQATSRDQANLAIHRQTLIVAPGSTQELRAVIQLSGAPRKECGLLDPPSKPLEPGDKHEDGGKIHENTGSESKLERIRSRQNLLIAYTKQISSKNPDLEEKRRISKIIDDHVDLGKACAKLDMVAEARYHLFVGCVLAEYLYREGHLVLSNARLIYANFLHKRGWPLRALEILEQLSETLLKSRSIARELTLLQKKVQMRLALIYMEIASFSKAESIYARAIPSPIADGPVITPADAHCLERLAWAQAQQGKYEEAHRSYTTLLAHPDIPHHVILSNIGFLERRLGRIEMAKKSFEKALEANTSGNAIDLLYARSGLYTCIHKLGGDPADHPEIAGYLVECFDAIPIVLRCCSAYFKPSFGRLPFQFAISRQLETLLSSCSVPVQDENGLPGIVFVDADPLGCLYTGRVAYFQFKTLTQVQKHMDEAEKKATNAVDDSHQETSDRIKAICQGHLVWSFKIAEHRDTWGTFYSVRGDVIDRSPAADDFSISYAVEGAYHFSKLWLYLNTWKSDWEFVLELLHFRLSSWLYYLMTNIHMSNLWVERNDYEALRPYDTISPDFASYQSVFPQYHLSDFTMLWLTFKQIEHLIDLLESRSDLEMRQAEIAARYRINEVRLTFDGYRKTLGSQTIRNNILKTFIVPKSGDLETQSSTDEKTGRVLEASGWNDVRTTVPLVISDKSLNLETSPTDGRPFLQTFKSRTPARQVFAFRRTISDYTFAIQSSDIATIEAAIAGFFEDSDEQVGIAWQENLKLQLDHNILGLESPPQIALILFAATFGYILANSPNSEIEKACLDRLVIALYDSGSFAQTIVGNAPETMRSWSGLTYETLSIVVGGLFPECRFRLPSHIVRPKDEQSQDLQVRQLLQERPSGVPKQTKPAMIPQQSAQQSGASSKPAPKNIVDLAFQPEWMYYHHAFLHELPLEIHVEAKLQPIDDFPGFKAAIDKWKVAKEFSSTRPKANTFPPHVADSGTKKGAGLDGDTIQRRLEIEWYGTAAAFYNCLTQPRTFNLAKKRLVELSSHNQETALICWLTVPEQEKPLFLEFLRRHGSSESFFGERVDWKGNIWETELHLGFHQLLTEQDNELLPPPLLDYHSQLRIRKMPSISQNPLGDEITPVAVSLRK